MPKSIRLISRDVDFRAAGDAENGDGRTLEGYGAVFDVPTIINSWEGRFTETISRGAFRKTLSERTPIVQYDHGRDVRVGSTPIAAIEELKEDDQGLYIQARLFDNDVVKPVRQAIAAQAISGMSFKFQVVRDEWRDNANKLVRGDELEELIYNPGERGPLNRNIKEVSLYELGPVAFPAYESTSVGVRAALDELGDDDRKRLLDELVAEARITSAEPESEEREDGMTRIVIDLPGATAESVSEAVEDVKRALDSNVPPAAGGKKPADKKPADGDKPKAKSYKCVADHGCGEGKYAVVDQDDKNESCHPSEEAAKAHIATLMGKKPATPGKKPFAPPQEKKSQTPAPTTTVTPVSGTTREESAMSENMTVEERVSRQSEIRARLSEIDTEYNGAALPEGTQNEWDGLNDEFLQHDDAIRAAEARSEQLRALAIDKPQRSERAGARTPVLRTRRPDNIYDTNEIRNLAANPDELDSLYRDNAMRAVEQAKYSGGVSKEQAGENIERLLGTVDKPGALAKRILQTGSPLYERAWGKAVLALNSNGLTGEEARALSLGSDSGGGYAVPFQLDPTVILDSDGVINPLRSLARVVQITGKKWQGVTSEGVTVSRSNEAAQVAESTLTFAQPEVNATRVTGFIPFSVELEATWGAMRSEITNILADAKATEESDSFVNGDGQSNAPFGVVATLDAGSHVADGNTFSSADVYALEEALPPRYRSRGQFLGNKSTYNAVRQFSTGNDGSDLWVRLGDGRPNQLIGYNAAESSSMDGVGSADGYLLFGDFKNFLIVDRIGMSVELVPHLFGANQRPTGQRGVLAIWSNGSKILVHNAFRLLKAAAS